MKKPSIKTLTVRNLVTFLLILSAILLLLTAADFRYASARTVEDRALALAELVKAGLTAHMKAGIMDRRDYFLKEIRELHQVDHLQVVRNRPVIEQFGAGRAGETTGDPLVLAAMAGGTPRFVFDEFTARPTIRAVIPYIASSAGSLNCLGCHQVAEGTVLGAVDIRLDVTAYRNQSLGVLLGLLLVSTLFLALILLNTSRTIQRYVQRPLETLVENARQAYRRQEPVSTEQFDTREFTRVANEINLFNNEIVAHQDLLRQKNLELRSLNDEIEDTLRETVYTMGVIEEQRSRETHNHTRRVTQFSRLLAGYAGLSVDEVELIAAATPLHDIGKLGIPDEVLFKPGGFTEMEREIMQNHARIGYTMLRHSQRDILQAAAIIALQHHEKWDGSGYPQGLAGEQIHVFGRVVAVADVFDALISPRVYKRAWSVEEVLAWMQQQSGRHFEPRLVDSLLTHLDEFLAIVRRYPVAADSAEGPAQAADMV